MMKVAPVGVTDKNIVDRTVCEQRGGFRVFYRQIRPVAELLDLLLPDPEQIIAGGEVFKRGSRNHSVRVILGGRNYFLKRYNYRGWAYQLGNLFRRSRAVRTWRIHLTFRNLGLPIQEPVLCLEQRRFRFLGRSYLLTEFIDGATPLIDLWPTLDADHKTPLLQDLAKQLAVMHRSGGIHGDLKWYNILIRRTNSGLMPILVDLDGSCLLRRVSESRIIADLERFLRDLTSCERDAALRGVFLDAWQSEVFGP